MTTERMLYSLRKTTSIAVILITLSLNAEMIYDFKKDSKMSAWTVVDDGVMGGRSSGALQLSKDGFGIYSGFISLDNYGGFSSIRLNIGKLMVQDFTHIVLRIKGDNKIYQLRIRADYNDRHVYSKSFFADSEWGLIEVPMKEMMPQFRGRRLMMENFNKNHIVELGILIGNKVRENFNLEIDYIKLK